MYIHYNSSGNWPDVSVGFTIVACSVLESGKIMKSSLALNPAIIVLLKQLWYCFLVDFCFVGVITSLLSLREGGKKEKERDKRERERER